MKTEHFKKKLEAERAKLETEMNGVGRRNFAVPGDWEAVSSETGTEADLVDQADVVTSHETNSAILADLEARYDMILTALSHIEKGTYGICEVCGEKIEELRLEADPSATTCMKDL